MVAFGGQRLKGHVRSFRGTWGFLTGEGFDGDLFVGLKGNPHLTGLSQGDEVEFEVKTDDRGKAEAVNVVLGGGQAPAAPSGRGWIREFKGQWGFINSDSFAGDLFVGLRSNPRLPVLHPGDEVEYDVRTDERGKTEAVNVRVARAPGAAPSSSPARPEAPSQQPPAPAPVAAQGPAERAAVPHLVGQALLGRIKRFRDQWGFVNSDSFAGDLFIHVRSNPALGPCGAGDPVQFEVAEDPTASGGFQAVNAVLWKADVRDLVGQVSRGWVKSFRGQWGLINSARFDGDVFVGLRSNPHLEFLQAGECVEFHIERDESSKNGIQAMKVKPIQGTAQLQMAQAPQRAAAPPGCGGSLAIGGAGHGGRSGGPGCGGGPGGDWALEGARQRPQAMVGRHCTGVCKSFREGWGFVVSDEFEGDLFVHSGSNPGMDSLQAGDNVSFDIALGTTGKCHAIGVQPVVSELKDLVGQPCSGRVRSFSDMWGFIQSLRFPGDLFIGLRSNPHLSAGSLRPGDQLEFTVQESAGKSRFEAVSVRVVHSATPAREWPSARSVSPGPLQRSRSPRAAPAAARAPQRQSGPLRDATSMVGDVVSGWIRKFKGEWGFINSEAFDGDLFVGMKQNQHLTRELVADDQVQFRVDIGPGGKAEAVDVQLISM